MPASRLLLIGWDAADWRIIDPLLARGFLPNLRKFLADGARANIRTLYPPLSPMLWTSIATGKRPYRHGIHGFSEPTPDGVGVRPISGLSRKTKALWNILGQNGLRSNVVGWWPSHPAEPIRGAMVSNFFHHPPPKRADWGDTLAPGTAHPPRLLEELAPLRVHPEELNEQHLLPFLPNLFKMDWAKDQRVHTLARILAECSTIQSAATALMQLEPWDFMAVYYDAVDHVCHGFMRYHPPAMPGVSDEDFENYKGVVEGIYHYHDLMLGVLLELAGPDTTVILMSDHGFHPDSQRLSNIPDEPAGPIAEHRPLGIFAARGPGVQPGALLQGLSLLDVAPTILHHFSLPMGEDMDGRVIEPLFRERRPVARIPSWDAVAGDDGGHHAEQPVSAKESAAALAQLVQLGYIDPLPENAVQAREETQRELDYNLARACMDGQRFAEAAAILRRLMEKYPDEHRFTMQLIASLERAGRNTEAADLIDAVIERKRRETESLREPAKATRENIRRKREAKEELAAGEERAAMRLWRRAHTNPETLAQLRARAALLRSDLPAAQRAAEEGLRRFPDSFNLRLVAARSALLEGKLGEAEDHLQKILAREPLHESAHLSLAQVRLARKKFWDAATSAQQVLALNGQNPWGYYVLGCALLRLRKPKLGIEALDRATTLNPGFTAAWERLAVFYERRKNFPGAAARAAACRARAAARPDTAPPSVEADDAALETMHRQVAAKLAANREPPAPNGFKLTESVVVVSGLPRSGSSLLMQMLAAGGLPLLTDGIRAADENNPRGFFEYEPVKKGRDYAQWLPQARGKAVKIVVPLVRGLPPDGDYRVVFCDRPLDQILASQAKMLARLGAKEEGASPERAFLRQVSQTADWMRERKIPCIVVDYPSTIADPAVTAQRLNAFFGGSLDERAMAAVVDAKLFRER